jgi:hypothetical protein
MTSSGFALDLLGVRLPIIQTPITRVFSPAMAALQLWPVGNQPDAEECADKLLVSRARRPTGLPSSAFKLIVPSVCAGTLAVRPEPGVLV